MIVWLSEHLRDIDAVGMCELASRLAGPLLVEDLLHRVEHVTAILRCGQTGKGSALVYQCNDLRHLGLYGLLRALDFFDLVVALLGQTCQILLKAKGAVVGGAIRPLLYAVLVGDSSRLILPLAEGVAKIIGCMPLLSAERAGLGVAQDGRKICVRVFDLSAIELAMRKRH